VVNTELPPLDSPLDSGFVWFRKLLSTDVRSHSGFNIRLPIPRILLEPCVLRLTTAKVQSSNQEPGMVSNSLFRSAVSQTQTMMARSQQAAIQVILHFYGAAMIRGIVSAVVCFLAYAHQYR
jgi:hypothetical protein